MSTWSGRRGAKAVVSLGVLLVGLGCTPKKTEVAAPRDAPAARPGGDARAEEKEKKPVSAPMSLELQVERTPDGAALRVYNAGKERVSLAAEVAARRGDSQLTPSALRLRLTCQSDGCVTLAPGAELLAPSWYDLVEAEHCDALFFPERPGEYTLRVTSCDGSQHADVTLHWQAP